MGNVTAESRFWAIIIGQLVGVLFFFAAGIVPFIRYGQLPDQNTRHDIKVGLTVITILGGIVFLALVIGLCWLLCLAKRSGEHSDKHVDYLLWAFVFVDLVGLLFAVYQQGGLSRSMFLPVFFLIPAAYLAVVNPSRINTTYYVIFSIAGCLVISFLASYYNVTKLPLLQIKVTDLSTLYRKGHNVALLIVCGVSLGIPALQLWIKEWLATKSA